MICLSFNDNHKLEFENDENLVKLAQQGNEEAQRVLLERYKYIASTKASLYFLPGGDHEDLFQEGMIGLFKAIRDYREGHDSSFKSFAFLCINRSIITAVKTANRQKQKALDGYSSLDKYVSPDGEEGNNHLPASYLEDPEEIFINNIEREEMEVFLREKLSPFEFAVVQLFIQGFSYREIAKKLRLSAKQVDNALCRARVKTKRYAEYMDTKDIKKEVSKMPISAYTIFMKEQHRKGLTKDQALEAYRELPPEEKEALSNKAKEIRGSSKVPPKTKRGGPESAIPASLEEVFKSLKIFLEEELESTKRKEAILIRLIGLL